MLPFSAPTPESMNSLLPGFEFTAMVSANGLGAVYFANQKSLDRQVAIKLLAPDAGIQGAFENKARASAGLKHPNIISIFDSGLVQGMPYLVMEFVPGKSLAHSTHGKAVDFAQAILLIDGICEGLGHAQAEGIIHGCFNPHNVLLNQKAEAKIGNFGLPISTRKDAAGDGVSRFIAPEVLARLEPATKRADVYSVGAVLYELLTGRSHGTDVPPPSEVCGTKRGIDAIWRQATDPDPAKRMADVRAFHTALKEASGRGKPAASAAADQAKASVESSQVKKPVPVANVGANWKLMRNFGIIAVLLYGIYFTWGHLEVVRTRRDKENREILAKQAADKERAEAEAARKRAAQAPAIPRSGISKETPTGSTMDKETPEESLERLSSRLASGSRSEMPVGSIRKGDCDYLLVSKRMRWVDAAWFAESHGGHLAAPNAEADAGWLVGELAKNETVWVGAGEGGTYMALGKSGASSAEDGSKLLPFIIQWHKDGSNPGSLAKQLAATRSSLSGKEPVFPAGTFVSGDRRHLLVMRPVTWKQAVDLAEQGGGHLMVVSDASESDAMKKMTAKLDADDGLWLGASLEGDLWRWTTGEAWQSADWTRDADATDEGCALVVRPGKGWDGRNREEDASGFIIEWSKDAASANAGGKAVTADEAAELTKRASELLAAAKQRHTEALAANVHKFSWDLDAYLRGLKKSSQLEWEPEVRNLKDCVKEDRLQAQQMESGIRLSQEMLKYANYHLKKQEEIDTQLSDGAAKIRDAFVAKMGEIAEAAKKAGQPRLVESIAESLKAAADLDGWIGSADDVTPE